MSSTLNIEAASSSPPNGHSSAARQRRFCSLDLAVAAILIVGTFLLYRPLVSNHRFGYDESDYVYAASQGIIANYVDRHAISFGEFLHIGTSHGLSPERKLALSRTVRASGDLPFYRHYHAPLYFYWLSGWDTLVAGHNEARVRCASVCWYALAAGLIYLGISLFPIDGARWAAILAAVLFVFSPTSIRTAVEIWPHTIYLFMALLTLFLASRWVQTRSSAWGWATLAALSLALLSIEYAVLLVLVYGLCAWKLRGGGISGRQIRWAGLFAVQTAALLLLAIAVLWAGGIFKLTILKNYIIFAYFALMRSGQAYGNQSLGSVWWGRVVDSPVEFVLLAAGLIAFAWRYFVVKDVKWLMPFGAYAVLQFLTSFRNHSTDPQYVSSLLPPICVLTAVALVLTLRGIGPVWRAATVGAVCACVIAGTCRGYILPKLRTTGTATVDQAVEFLQTLPRKPTSLLCDHTLVPALHYYFAQTNVVPMDEGPTAQWSREVTRPGYDAALCIGPSARDEIAAALRNSGRHDVRVEHIAGSGETELSYVRISGAVEPH